MLLHVSSQCLPCWDMALVFGNVIIRVLWKVGVYFIGAIRKISSYMGGMSLFCLNSNVTRKVAAYVAKLRLLMVIITMRSDRELVWVCAEYVVQIVVSYQFR